MKKRYLILIFLIFAFGEVLAASSANIISTATITICGDGAAGTGEECDGSDLKGQSCASLGYTGGTLACYADCTLNTSSCLTGGGGGGGGGGSVVISPAATTVVIQGKAYPNCPVTILRDGALETTVEADSGGNFKATITKISEGVYTFGLWAEDKLGDKSITFSFTGNVYENKITTIAGIFIPPTITSANEILSPGEPLSVLGYTAPKSEVSIHVNSTEEIIEKTTATLEGEWSHDLDTRYLGLGTHIAKAKAVSLDGLKSSFSDALSFVVGYDKIIIGKKRALVGDVNRDGRVNLIDFSILLFNWETPANLDADLNGDGNVNIVDFSILLYHWTG